MFVFPPMSIRKSLSSPIFTFFFIIVANSVNRKSVPFPLLVLSIDREIFFFSGGILYSLNCCPEWAV